MELNDRASRKLAQVAMPTIMRLIASSGAMILGAPMALKDEPEEVVPPAKEPVHRPSVRKGQTHIRIKFEHRGSLGLDISTSKDGVTRDSVIICGRKGVAYPVEASSTAGKVGLALGDVIVAVQGLDVTGLKLKEVKQEIKECTERPLWIDFIRETPEADPSEEVFVPPWPGWPGVNVLGQSVHADEISNDTYDAPYNSTVVE